MTIDWSHFTPAASFAGGALIGIAAAMLLLLSGRVAGVSGIIGRRGARGCAGNPGKRPAFLTGPPTGAPGPRGKDFRIRGKDSRAGRIRIKTQLKL